MPLAGSHPLSAGRPRLRTLLWLALPFLMGWAALTGLFYQRGYTNVLDDAGDRLESTLLFHRALHRYVEKVQKPEIYRLKDEGRLYPAYFSPKVLSFTYIARNVQQFLAEERARAGKPKVFFKLAARDPRNPINRADPFETGLLARMNADQIDEYRSVVERNGGRYLYLALPVRPNTRSCMRCHGDPADAPAELVAQYGDEAGFHEALDDIRALIALWTPLDAVLAGLRRDTLVFAGASLLVLSLIYALIARLTWRLRVEQARVLEQNRELERLSSTDSLTGLFNRRQFNRQLAHEIERAHRYGTPLSLMILDLDHFKDINDRFGHPTGDEVLRAFGAFLREHSRASDLVARWGGEEFALLLPQTGLKDARLLADSLRGRLSLASFPEGIEFTVSIGVAGLDADSDADTLVRRTDRALYRAKRAGRDRVAVAGSDESGITRGVDSDR